MSVTFSGNGFPWIGKSRKSKKAVSSGTQNQVSLSGVNEAAAKRLGVRIDPNAPSKKRAADVDNLSVSSSSKKANRSSMVNRLSKLMNDALNLTNYFTPASNPYADKAGKVLGRDAQMVQIDNQPSSKLARHATSHLNLQATGDNNTRVSIIEHHVKPSDQRWPTDTMFHRNSIVSPEDER